MILTPISVSAATKKCFNEGDFVQYNQSSQEFEFIGENCSNLTPQKQTEIKNQIKISNQKLKLAIEKANMRVAIRPVDPKTGKTLPSLTPTFRDRGVTKVDVRWNHIRVYLSQDTARNVSAVISVIGIWMPEGTVSKVIASVGAIGTQFAPALWFDYNFFLQKVTAIGLQ